MSKPKDEPQQTLPGMHRRHRPDVRRPEPGAAVKPYRIELDPELDAAASQGAGLAAELEAAPPSEPAEATAQRCREPYDDTRRGYVGAPHAGTQPSYDAAKAIAPAAANMRKKIYEYIHAQAGHGATPDEVRAALDMLITTVGPRFIELRERRKIFKVDETRPTQTGKPARVHVADEYVDTSNLDELEADGGQDA